MSKKRKDYLDDYLNYDDFTYDFKADPLYQAMKKEYLSQAERSAEDVLGKYSVISGGGSPSSAAVAAATESSNKIKSELTEVIPELYDLAWERYSGELENKRNKYEALLKEYKTEKQEDEVADEPEVSDDFDIPSENSQENAPVKQGASSGKAMDDGMFDMTVELIKNLMKNGDKEKAERVFEMYKNSMSSSQKREMESLIAG